MPTDPNDPITCLTKRECFAAHALAGMLADPHVYPTIETARSAVDAADLLIAALNAPASLPGPASAPGAVTNPVPIVGPVT